MKYEKLSEYARRNGISYRTAWNHYKKGLLKNTKQLSTGTILIRLDDNTENKNTINVALYSRVSSSENKNNLITQQNRLIDYASAKGYIIVKNIKEIGSGVNDNRKQLINLLQDNSWDILIVEHKDRLTRFGFNYIKILLENQNKSIEVINQTNEKDCDLMEDLISIIYSFSARMYGLRRNKRKTEYIIRELKELDK